MRVIAVKFKQGSTVYTSNEVYYKSPFPVSAGQFVVVETVSGFQVALVVDTDVQGVTAYDYVVQVVDTSTYDKFVKLDNKLVDLVKEIKEIDAEDMALSYLECKLKEKKGL